MNLEEANSRISQLEKALMLMVYQYCVTDDQLDHRCMCAGEHAFAALGLENGDSVENLEEMRKLYYRAGQATRVHLRRGSSPVQ